MRVAMIQPSYLPWLGYFEQMARVDEFIFLDDVQYTRKDWRNRNRIKTPYGAKWLTVPVRHAPHATLINQIEINYLQDWRASHLNLLRENYRKARYYEEIMDLIATYFDKKFTLLSVLNMALTEGVANYLGLFIKTFLSSQLKTKSGDRNERIIDLCKWTKATTLYDGQSARNFIDDKRFQREGVEVTFQDYRHPEYRQFQGPFISHLSVVDLLFHYGPGSLPIIAQGHEATNRLLAS